MFHTINRFLDSEPSVIEIVLVALALMVFTFCIQ